MVCLLGEKKIFCISQELMPTLYEIFKLYIMIYEAVLKFVPKGSGLDIL